jgi:hypothetical protein
MCAQLVGGGWSVEVVWRVGERWRERGGLGISSRRRDFEKHGTAEANTVVRIMERSLVSSEDRGARVVK